VLPGRRADGETPVRVACRVRLTCSFFTIRGLAPLEQVSANARGVGATEALVYQRATAQPASAGNVINKNNHLGAKSPIDSLPAHSPGSDDIRRSILARCVAASLGCAGRMPQGIGGKRSGANCGSNRRKAERRQSRERSAGSGAAPTGASHGSGRRVAARSLPQTVPPVRPGRHRDPGADRHDQQQGDRQRNENTTHRRNGPSPGSRTPPRRAQPAMINRSMRP